MNRTEFREAVDRHGEDLATWPLAERNRASLFLAREPEARCILDEARALRAAFADRPGLRAPAGLADRIVRAALGDDAAGATQARPAKAALSR